MRRKWKSIVGRGSRGSVTMKGGVWSRSEPTYYYYYYYYYCYYYYRWGLGEVGPYLWPHIQYRCDVTGSRCTSYVVFRAVYGTLYARVM